MLCANDVAFKMNIPTTSITFDQLMWIKAIKIVEKKKRKIVVRLGDIILKDFYWKHRYVYGSFWFRKTACASVQRKECC